MSKKILLLISALLIPAAGMLAQGPQGQGDSKQLPSKVQRLNKAPVNNEILKVKLPHPTEVALPNGLSLLILEQHRLPTVYFGLWHDQA